MWFLKIVHHIDILWEKKPKYEISILTSDSIYFWPVALKSLDYDAKELPRL